MPTYEYQCAACSHRFELFQSITAKPVKKCPACGKNKANRLLGTGAGMIFKGSGFYITDYRSESYQAAAKAESGASNANGSSASGGTPPTNGSTASGAPSSSGSPSTPAPSSPAQVPASSPKSDGHNSAKKTS